MKDFLFIYRMNYAGIQERTPEQMQATMQRWMDWMGHMAAKDQLIDRGNRLHPSGKVVGTDGIITDGPYTEIKESIGGYSLVRAASCEEAAELAKGCPVLTMGGNVEVREINAM
ncbi:MAG: YciI family protein [Chitinophagaceae bacterium]